MSQNKQRLLFDVQQGNVDSWRILAREYVRDNNLTGCLSLYERVFSGKIEIDLLEAVYLLAPGMKQSFLKGSEEVTEDQQKNLLFWLAGSAHVAGRPEVGFFWLYSLGGDLDIRWDSIFLDEFLYSPKEIGSLLSCRHRAHYFGFLLENSFKRNSLKEVIKELTSMIGIRRIKNPLYEGISSGYLEVEKDNSVVFSEKGLISLKNSLITILPEYLFRILRLALHFDKQYSTSILPLVLHRSSQEDYSIVTIKGREKSADTLSYTW